MTDADVPDTLPPTDDPYRAPEAENPHAGKGSAVVLDIGGDVGAVIVTCPDPLLGREIEVVPAGSRATGGAYADAPVEHTHDDHHDHHDHQHHDDHDHNDDHDHDHDHDDEPGHHHGDFHAGHDHPPGTPPHVGVVARPVDGRLVPTAVFGDLVEGRYEFALRPYGGTPDLEVDVVGGEVAMVDWPVG